MHQYAIMEGFESSRISNMLGLHMQVLRKVRNISKYGWRMPEWTVLTMARLWICLVKVQSFEYGSSSEYAKVQNMARLWICEGDIGCWITLNDSICVNMSWYVLSILEYVYIYLNKQSSKYARILNVSGAVNGIRTL